MRDLDNCPNCGADLPARARACPECGSDEKTGWSEEARASHLGLPDDSFDYNEFVEREFEGKDRSRSSARHWFWWVCAVLVLAVFLWLVIPRL